MNSINTVQSTIKYIKKELKSTYTSREGESISYLLLENVMQCSRSQIQLQKTKEISDCNFTKIQKYVQELQTHKPIQYVLGNAYFYDMHFRVSEHTLIPRPETEELVHAIILENTTVHLKVLDIGTGSGCIPICLAKYLPNAIVTSIDISDKAIEIAKSNANVNQANVEFLNRDILNWDNYNWDSYDIIVSNPPYVTDSEKEKMNKNVLNFEPHTALFVPDHDPLIFYRKIADFAHQFLKKGGKLYLEINERFGLETKKLLVQKSFKNVMIRNDIHGKQRIISAEK